MLFLDDSYQRIVIWALKDISFHIKKKKKKHTPHFHWNEDLIIFTFNCFWNVLIKLICTRSYFVTICFCFCQRCCQFTLESIIIWQNVPCVISGVEKNVDESNIVSNSSFKAQLKQLFLCVRQCIWSNLFLFFFNK